MTNDRDNLARECLAECAPGLCLNESEKQGIAIAMLTFATRLPSLGVDDGVRKAWLPIESAPKDAVIDLWVVFPACGDDLAHEARWADSHWDTEKGDWKRAGGFCLHQFMAKPRATHWKRRDTGPAALTPANKQEGE